MKDFIYQLIIIINYFIVCYVIIIVLWSLIQMLGGLCLTFLSRRIEQVYGMGEITDTSELIPISIIAPAFNEGKIIIESVKSMLSLDYSIFEIIVVNDGSTDGSLEKLIEEFNVRKVGYPIPIHVPCAKIRGVYRNPEIPNLTIVDKENGGNKADACNAGINVSKYPYFIAMDSDCLLDRDALTWISRTFMSNKNCVAVGGMMRMSNGNEIRNHNITNFHMPKNWLVRFQVLEYCRSFLVGRVLTSRMGCLMVISGAFGAFHKESVINVGGYSLDSFGEDMDLVLKLHKYMHDKRHKYKIGFSPKAICWTQGPAKYKELRGQRRRWHVGLIQVMYKFKGMMFNPKYGAVGMIGMPYQFMYETCGPIIELLGCIVIPTSLYLGIITPYGFILFCTAGLLLGILVSVGSLAIDVRIFNRTISPKDFLLLCFLCVIEFFIFHPLIVLFRLQAIFGYFKIKHRWDHITRHSFKDN